MTDGLSKMTPPAGAVSFLPQGSEYVDLPYAGEICARRDTWCEHNGWAVLTLEWICFSKQQKNHKMGGMDHEVPSAIEGSGQDCMEQIIPCPLCKLE
jgi:hypothetical protein